MKKTYLISNKLDATLDDMDFPLGDDDHIILFNHAYPIKFEKIRLFENKTLMIRKSDRGYLGAKRARGPNMGFKRLVMIGSREDSADIARETLIPEAETVEEEDMLKGLDARMTGELALVPKGKSPTTGFYGFLYATKRMPESETVLVGFTGESSVRGVKKWSGHSYEFEREFYRKIGVKRHASRDRSG